MRHGVEVPALDGRNPLGFLSALGLLRVLPDAGVESPGLSFSPDSAAAVVHSPLASLDDILAVLEAYIVGAGEGAAIVGINADFPLRPGKNADPMRRARESYRQLAEEIRHIDAKAANYWLPHLLTDLAVDQKGRVGLTPFSAPFAKQSLRTFFTKPLGAIRANPGLIREALTAWRRVEGFTGEYFDHHVINSAADNQQGRTEQERGVPGATWLATMALPVLRVTGDGQDVVGTLWHHVGRRRVMIWPLWRQALDVPGVQALIEHPCLAPANSALAIRRSDWEPLGIIGVYGAERQRTPGQQYLRVLAPIQVPTTG